MRAVLPVVLLLALVPVTASAVTVQEIVTLAKAGVSEPVILALIERDKTIFTITPEQLLTLQKEGLTDAVLPAMLRSGRQEAALPEPPSPLPPAFAPQYDQYDPREPNIVLVGHGPDRPNVGDASYSGPYAVPYLVPVPYPVPVRVPRSHRGVRQTDVPSRASPATGIFFDTPARGIFFDR